MKKKPNNDEALAALYVELDGVDIAIKNAMWTVEAYMLNQRRAEILGEIKNRERRKHA
jgi:hypothetical protein